MNAADINSVTHIRLNTTWLEIVPGTLQPTGTGTFTAQLKPPHHYGWITAYPQQLTDTKTGPQ